ncbi:hypothetical protein BTHE68_24950 [Burkholderia sp. THE68]|uniref:hypothetical protein n=1 Tax=Burkholderia sp. THE68 TaxID=758782 RepID=UPI0013196D3E|nr:hypothetical protein [Burkholderia sp. THE68]BBU28761.1 hypothetical protein BTHE68_24950 [Burkholderia sp. THE68]
MSIDVSDLLSLAQKLSEGKSECEWRAGASRAYYAAYHRALEIADRHLPSCRDKAGVHVQLERRLVDAGKKGGELAYMLRELKKVRTQADYRLAIAFEQPDASDFVATCQLFLPMADLLDAHLERTETATS